jgi:23S rRNA pseudouridine2605 synthase
MSYDNQPKDDRSDENQIRTLDRVISKAGLGSRTEARSWIGAGRVAVNGKKIQSPDLWVDPDTDEVTLDGRPLSASEKQYVLLYKPKGYLTTYKDPDGRPTIYDLLGGIKDFLFPVGRLDQDTTGLLILTNDGGFGEHVMHPDSKVPKTYLVKSSQLLSEEQLDQLRHGVALSDGVTAPAHVKRVRDSEKYTFFEITITEGRNRQVRRMVEALGTKVLKLVRVRIGTIEIAGLEIGKYRPLTAAEIAALRKPGKLSRASDPDSPSKRRPPAKHFPRKGRLRRNESSAHAASETRRPGRND